MGQGDNTTFCDGAASFPSSSTPSVGCAVFEWILDRHSCRARKTRCSGERRPCRLRRSAQGVHPALLRRPRPRPHLCDGPTRRSLDASTGECRLHAARVLTTVHRHVLQQRHAHKWPLGVVSRRLELEVRLLPNVHEGPGAVRSASEGNDARGGLAASTVVVPTRRRPRPRRLGRPRCSHVSESQRRARPREVALL
jgi:hypothetical protein